MRRAIADNFMTGTSGIYVESLFEAWKQDPDSVHVSWNAYFSGLELGIDQVFDAPGASGSYSAAVKDSVKAMHLLRGFQFHGYVLADLDPLKLQQNIGDYTVSLRVPGMIQMKNYGFTQNDLTKEVYIGSDLVRGFADATTGKKGKWRLEELVEAARKAYCQKIGFDFMHIPFRDEINWIISRTEATPMMNNSAEDKKLLLNKLLRSCMLEEFFHTKFSTHKRFGLDGLEGLICGVEAVILQAARNGVDNIVIGMPHRGRLNLMANVLKTSLEDMLGQFLGTNSRLLSEGDVKYHLGATVQREIEGRLVTISLVANPSHLEAVDPVVVGKARAIQNYRKNATSTMAIIIHGDAALAGQGVVYETLQMGDLFDYTTRGTVHIVANNNIGFTTSPRESRSTQFCTEIARSMSAPIFHVNGDCPEEIDFVCKLAADWRQEFSKDVFVDIIGYRRHGHNELDEPMFTQPKMYQMIHKQPLVWQVYADVLINEGVVTSEEVAAMQKEIKEIYESAYNTAKTVSPDELKERYRTYTEWSPLYVPEGDIKKTGLDTDRLMELGLKMTTLPEEFNPHPQIRRIFKNRMESIERGSGIDWATAEALAFASLLTDDKIHVRLSGQDVERGTFSQRHAVVHDQKHDMKEYVPLAHLEEDQAQFEITNSHLSEYAVLGFEYGYSITNPNSLIMWEAQFGDFVNGAQIMIDQFIAPGEAKWGLQSGLVLLLPHGYDGQGAEHSCARIGRFLELSADDPFVIPWEHLKERNQTFYNNIQVVNPSTPANYFHFLRRQIRRDFRKPLIVASPKRLLRLKTCASDLSDFSHHRVARVLDDPSTNLVAPEQIAKVIICSGQIYYDLIDAREKQQICNIAIVRLEQIAPFPYDKIQEVAYKYKNAPIQWVQEEPMNLGAWDYVQPRLETALSPLGVDPVSIVSRPPHAAAATGYMSVHMAELAKLLEQAMASIK
jgi:2-oxoglutarate dehydrogenase E1 component